MQGAIKWTNVEQILLCLEPQWVNWLLNWAWMPEFHWWHSVLLGGIYLKLDCHLAIQQPGLHPGVDFLDQGLNVKCANVAANVGKELRSLSPHWNSLAIHVLMFLRSTDTISFLPHWSYAMHLLCLPINLAPVWYNSFLTDGVRPSI